MATAASATTTAAASEEAAAPAPAPAPRAAPHDEEAAFEAFATCDFARALRLARAELLLGEGEDAESRSESGEGEDGPGVSEGAAEGGGVPLVPIPGTSACSVALTEACSRCVGFASASFVDYNTTPAES